MSKKSVDQAIADAENTGLFSYPKRPVSLDEISSCESSIGYSFPASYHHFLASYGFAGIAGTEFCGLIVGDLNSPSHLNAFNFTKEMREEFELPRELFAFENFDGDAVACLFLSQKVDDECPVILWDHSESFERQFKKPHILASSFGEYFFEKIKKIVDSEESIKFI